MKDFTIRVVAGANVALIIAMLITGYADRINPTAHPLLANIGLLFPAFLLANIAFLVFWLVVKKRWALIPVAGLLVGFGPVRIYSPLNVSQEAPEGCLKVMSYNVFSFSTWSDTSKPSEILEYIKEQNPDILCMQEANTTSAKQAIIDSTLLATLPHKDTIGDGSLAIYTAFPIVGKERINYSTENHSQSAAFFLKTGKSDTTIVVTSHFEITGITLEQRSHFKAMLKGKLQKDSAEIETRQLWSCLAHSAAVRAPQADAVAEFISRHTGKSIVLMGDFNDHPLSYTRRRIAQELTDCYVSTANGPGISYHYNGFYVRIDNIMCSSQWKPYSCRVDNSIKASDHYPIVCQLKRQ